LLLKSILRVPLVLLGSVPFSGSALQAEDHADEHTVMILAVSYFPQVTELNEGDYVRFVNASGQEHTIIHSGGVWATLPIRDGQEMLVEIEAGMAGEFHGLAARLITGRLDLVRTRLLN
jgi:plastocyanin